MARTRRKRSRSGYYHVILRGINRQEIFLDDEDRMKMLKCMRRFREETGTVICAYCLMDNHIHLLLHNEEGPDVFIKKIASSYVYHFNHKYDRVGHLFQDRYKSEPVEDDRYLIAVFRYILQNPWKAGICRPNEYKWNSWSSVEGEKTICDIKAVIAVAKDLGVLRDFVFEDNQDEFLEENKRYMLSEAEALQKTIRLTGGDNPMKISQYSKEKREEILFKMKKTGMSIRQISRITGINRNTVQRAGESRTSQGDRFPDSKSESRNLSP